MTGWSPTARRVRRRSTRGALTVIAVFLVGSALLRLGNSAGQAFALAAEDIDAAPLPAAAQGMACKAREDLQPLLIAFQAREARIAQQEEAISSRMQALSLADDEIVKKLAALKQAEQDLREMIALAETAAEGDLARLTKVYETMKPKQAAALFEEMAPEFAAGFIGRMRPEAAAAIMAGLSPEAAHRFSVVLAGRNAEVPSE